MPVLSGMSTRTRNGTIGFVSSLGFLGFVGWFNEKINTYKAEKGLTKGKKGPAKPDKDLYSMISSIFRKACGVREAWTIAALCTSLLLRTLGSVWVAKHWCVRSGTSPGSLSDLAPIVS